MPVLLLAQLSPSTLQYVILGVAALTGLAVLMHIYFQMKRSEDLEVIATELGMAFSAKEDSRLLNKLQFFPTFRLGHTSNMKNVMQMATEHGLLSVFEYSYSKTDRLTDQKYLATTDRRDFKTRTYHFTFATLEIPEFLCPHFSVRPQGFMDETLSNGMQDINFPYHPIFSNSFLLYGQDEQGIRHFFDNELMNLFATKRNAYVEAGNDVVALRLKGRQKLEDIKKFIAEADEFLGGFKHCSADPANQLV